MDCDCTRRGFYQNVGLQKREILLRKVNIGQYVQGDSWPERLEIRVIREF